jgi:hypothetical protein
METPVQLSKFCLIRNCTTVDDDVVVAVVVVDVVPEKSRNEAIAFYSRDILNFTSVNVIPKIIPTVVIFIIISFLVPKLALRGPFPCLFAVF